MLAKWRQGMSQGMNGVLEKSVNRSRFIIGGAVRAIREGLIKIQSKIILCAPLISFTKLQSMPKRNVTCRAVDFKESSTNL